MFPKAYDATGNLAFSIENTTSANGLSIINRYDDNGDTSGGGWFDQVETRVKHGNGMKNVKRLPHPQPIGATLAMAA